MSVALITGSAGLIGSEAVRHFAQKGMDVVGIDNDMRKYFFGAEASTNAEARDLQKTVSNYRHHLVDIRNADDLKKIFQEYGNNIRLIIHAAAQPSHDWAAREPLTDFAINAVGTMNLLELTRSHCPEAVFIFTSTNKVYGDTPNFLPLVEKETRWEIAADDLYSQGIDETMSVDQCKHSIFGASKLAADVMVQEYGLYFAMKTAAFRGGCLTGPRHAGAQLHGFLAYLMKCAVTGRPYTIFGYKGKQVRDNIHSHDLIRAFEAFFENPRRGEVYNIGGGMKNNCSLLEAVRMCEEIAGRPMKTEYTDDNRSGDHIWYISSLKKFTGHYPDWRQVYTLEQTLKEIHEHNAGHWKKDAV